MVAECIYFAFKGRVNGLKTQLTSKYKIFAADPGKYLDIQTYLPPREMLKQDFVWVKPSNMPVQQLSAWAIHLYAQQQRRHQGKDIEVFAFYVLDKHQRPDDVNGGCSSASQNLNQPGEEQSPSQGPRM